MRSIIRVENLSKRYTIGERKASYGTLRESLSRAVRLPFGGRRGAPSSDRTIWALKELSFEVRPGEILGIIGRNGAGKSTLLKVLSRITEPTTGRIELYGRLGSLLEVGTGFHPELTGRENIYLNGAILGMRRSEIEHKFDEIVAFAEIEKFLDTPVKHYSSGMYMRLAFAVASSLEPEILVVDEVLAVGDSEFQQKCLGKMDEISKEGRTVLLVSHNMPSIINLCQRAILLSGGKIIAEGRPAEVIHDYLSTAGAAGGEAIWHDPEQAPGTEVVRLHSVRILQEGIEGATADVDISKEVVVEISYWNLQENAPLYSGIWLRDQLGTIVLSSSNLHSISLTEDPWYGRPHPLGLFRSVCRIPGNFLNEGHYSISAILGKVPDKTQVLEDQVLSFNVHDTGEMRKLYYGKWVGTVRPRLAWHTEYREGVSKADASKVKLASVEG
jgi:lipopolysaccharide transport system ATP-binding protein